MQPPEYELIARRKEWSRIQVFAWLNEPVLKGMRTDPKRTLIDLSNGIFSQDPNVVVVVDEKTKDAAKGIVEKADTIPGEVYVGYLPIPRPTGGIDALTLNDLTELVRNGLTGILKFDRKAEIWADIFQQAWKDETLLINIRQDPLRYLPQKQKDELLTDEYGIFPLPGFPEGLEDLTIDKLDYFLSDYNNMKHISGIFLLGS